MITDELLVIKDVTERLDLAKISYMITGSIALSYYTTPRFTRDIDIVIEVVPSDRSKLVKLFEEGYYISQDDVKEATENRTIFNIIHNETVLKIDFIIKKTEEYRQVEFKRKVKTKINGFDAWLVSKEDLILSKLVWAKESGSSIQLSDVKSLLASGPYDSDYLLLWVKYLNISAIFNKLKV
jgi:hypothetical protein